MISELIKNKTHSEKVQMKSKEIAKLKHIGAFVDSKRDLTIEITYLKEIEGGIEILARSWQHEQQVGFDKDGSVDLERFRIYNPPILVPDSLGSYVRTFTNPTTGVSNIERYREDLTDAIRQDLARTINSMIQGSIVAHVGSKNIVSDKIGNTTSTFRSDADPETDTTDGYIRSRAADNTWTTAHDATDGDAANDAGTLIIVGIYSNQGGDNLDYLIHRGVLLFKTGAIAATDTIDSVTLAVVANAVTDTSNDGNDFISVVQTQGQNLASNTSLALGDFDQVGSAIDNPTEGHDAGERKDITGVSAGTTQTYTFNATGRGWIARSGEAKPTGATAGITYLGLREGHDITDTDPGDGLAGTEIDWRSADTVGTTDDPLLTVTHSLSSSVKTIDGLARASVKTVNGLAIASVKTVIGLA